MTLDRHREALAPNSSSRGACDVAIQNRPGGGELGAFGRKEGFDVAHVGVLREQGLADAQVVRHVGGLYDQHEVGAGRDAPALLHGIVGHGAGFKGVQVFAALTVQRHFHQRGQAVAQRGAQLVTVEHRDLPLDPAAIDQALDAAQAGGRRDVDLFGQRHIAHAGVTLQAVQQLEVDGIKYALFHKN